MASTSSRENGSAPLTTYSIVEKEQLKTAKFKENINKHKYLNLSNEDIELITNPQTLKRKLNAEDVRILVALISTTAGKAILIDDLAKKISPDKLSGFAKEIASIPSRIAYYNSVILKGSGMHIMPMSQVDEESPVGYYVTGHLITNPQNLSYTINMHERVRLLKMAITGIEKVQNITGRNDQYKLSSAPLEGGRIIAVCVNKGEEFTKPVVFKDIEIEDTKAPKHLRVDEDGKVAKPPTYLLKAFRQFKLFSMLFQNEPVSTRILRTHLADDGWQISQRELQFYIDILNNSLPTEIKKELAEKGTKLPDDITKFGLCITIDNTGIKGEDETIKLSGHDRQNPPKTNLSGQYDTTLMDTVIKRQRRRKPSYAKMRL